MAYATSVPLVRLNFSDGFKYYGDTTAITASATVNLPVDQITHTPTGETLVDGQLLPMQEAAYFDVPDPRTKGWVAGNSHITKWSYDVTLSITKTGHPSLLWSATISPHRSPEVVTPGMGSIAAGETSSATVTEIAPGEYTIGA